MCTNMGQSLRHPVSEKNTVWNNAYGVNIHAHGRDQRENVCICLYMQRIHIKLVASKETNWVVGRQGGDGDLSFAEYSFVPIKFL